MDTWTIKFIKIINDIRFNSDSGKISVLVLLDLSAAFDTVDHNILLERLENCVGLSGMALKWFRSYLEGRGYYVSIGECYAPSRGKGATWKEYENTVEFWKTKDQYFNENNHLNCTIG